jgi:hypothetical protein
VGPTNQDTNLIMRIFKGVIISNSGFESMNQDWPFGTQKFAADTHFDVIGLKLSVHSTSKRPTTPSGY